MVNEKGILAAMAKMKALGLTQTLGHGIRECSLKTNIIMPKRKRVHLIIVTDCGGSDEGRYRITAGRCFFPHEPRITFFPTESMNTLHCGFTAAAHALSTIDLFGPLRQGEQIGILANAAPRHGTENGRRLRGEDRKPEGEEIYALKLRNGVWVIGPNAGYNFFFLENQVVESFLLTDTSGRSTPFRSMEVMVPAFAKIFGADFPHLHLTKKKLQVADGEDGVFVADWDSHGNIYLVSTVQDKLWVPARNQSCAFHIGTRHIARLRHVNGIFAGNTGEQTLTVGSLHLNGKPVYYIVIVGGNAHSFFGNPPVGTRVQIEEE